MRSSEKKIINRIKKEFEGYSRKPLNVLPPNAIPMPKLVFGYDELFGIIDK